MVDMTQITINEIEQLLTSKLPHSIERVAEILRQSLKIYPGLKEQFLKGSPEERKQAKKLAGAVIAFVEEEMRKAREELDLRQTTFDVSLASYLSPHEMFLFREARETIRSNQEEFFPKISFSSKKKPKQPTLRC